MSFNFITCGSLAGLTIFHPCACIAATTSFFRGRAALELPILVSIVSRSIVHLLYRSTYDCAACDTCQLVHIGCDCVPKLNVIFEVTGYVLVSTGHPAELAFLLASVTVTYFPSALTDCTIPVCQFGLHITFIANTHHTCGV